MAQNQLETVVHKLLNEPEFRDEFERDRTGVLARFPLDEEQRSALLSMKVSPLVTAAHGVSAAVDPDPI